MKTAGLSCLLRKALHRRYFIAYLRFFWFFVKCWGDPLIHLVEEHFIGVFLFFFGLLSIHK